MNPFNPLRRFGMIPIDGDRLPALAPVLSRHGVVPPEIDRQLGSLGSRANEGDRDAQNALYAAFSPRLDHWVRRAQGNCLRQGADPAIEPGDIAQLAFIVFVDLLNGWDGEDSLSRHIIALFPWRLQDAVRLLEDRRPRVAIAIHTNESLADGTYAGDETLALVLTIASSLSDREGAILTMRIAEGLGWDAIANRLGIDRRTALRDWHRIRLRLRKELTRAR